MQHIRPNLAHPLKRIAIALLTCAVLIAGCGIGGNDNEFANVLNRSLGPEPESLDVHAALSTQAATVLRDLGEGLTGYSVSGELVAAAAERWEVSDDGLEYRFWLRPEARWSNGESVTAEHFVYSFRRLVDPQTAAPYAQHLIDIENAEAIVKSGASVESLAVTAEAAFELTIRLRRPVPYFLKLLAHNSTYPVFPPSVEEHGKSFARAGNLVSNGAYKLDARTMGAVISLSRNEHYWNNAQTAIDRVRHFVTPDETAEANRFRAGELDITETVSTQMFAKLREEMPDRLIVAPYLQVYYYGLNLTKPPFKGNRKLRQALSMAIDREIIVDSVIGRGEKAAYGWIPPGVNNYNAMTFTWSKHSAEDRHATARRLYLEAGYSKENPLQVEIRFNTSDSHKNVALAVQAMWSDVLGVETTLINEEFRVLLANMLAKEKTQVFRSSWSGDYNDPASFLDIMESDNPSNLPGFSDEKYDGLLTRAANQMDPMFRQVYLEEAETRLLEEHPVIPIYFYVSKHLVSSRVIGWQDNVLDYHYSQHLRLKTND